MITNILLGLILGVVITSFIILNNKINRTEFNTKFVIDVLKNIDNYVDSNNTNIQHLVDRFNKRILIDGEYYNNIITLLKSRFKDLDNATDSIYDRFNTIHADIEKYITEEHITTRRQIIEKQAKISSKINSKKKTKNDKQK